MEVEEAEVSRQQMLWNLEKNLFVVPQMIDPMDVIEEKPEEQIESKNNETSNGYTQPTLIVSEKNKNGTCKPKGLSNGLQKGTKKFPDDIQISMPTESRNKLPLEWWKTGIAVVYVAFSLFLSTIMVAVVHERVPPKELNPPLPDKFFYYIDRVEWAFSVTEINGMILIGLGLIQWMFLRYKSIVGRRCFFILGTIHFYRCITIYVTTLPVSEIHYPCAPKLNGDSQAWIQRILKMFSSGGLYITGTPKLCGDYLFSGHTVMLTLPYLFIKEYSPRHFWWYHLICWCISVAGIICILLSHEHYTIDVIIAYFITTRLFWCYHSMANEKNLKVASQMNLLSRIWWYPVFNFFEKNVQDSVPCCFSWPVSWSPNFSNFCVKYIPKLRKLKKIMRNLLQEKKLRK